MGLFSGVGKFITKALTPPTKGPLSFIGKPLRKISGEGGFVDELGTAAGFALGGAPGAALGRGIGRGAQTGNIGKALGGALEGYALGTGYNAAANALGGGGLSGAASEIGRSARPIAGVGRALSNATGITSPAPATDMGGNVPTPRGGIGGALGSAVDWLTDPQSGENRLRLLGLGAGTVGSYLSGQTEGRAVENQAEDAAWKRQRAERLDPQRDELLRIMMETLKNRQQPRV